MIFTHSATIGDILEGWDLPFDVECGMYVFTGLDASLYSGISRDPVGRVLQHLGCGSFGRSPDLVGRIVLGFRPESLSWRVFFPTVDETIAFASPHFPAPPRWDCLKARGARAVSERCEWVFVQQLECLANSAKVADKRSGKSSALWDQIYSRLGVPDAGQYLGL